MLTTLLDWSYQEFSTIFQQRIVKNMHLKKPYFATFQEFSTLSTDHNNTTTNYSYYYVYVMQKIEKMRNWNKNANESVSLEIIYTYDLKTFIE